MRSLIDDIRQHGRITTGYISAFGLLLISFLLTMYANKQLMKKAELVERTNKIITNLGSMLSAVKDAEIGYQGFLMSRNIRFLTPYIGSRLTADSIYRETNLLLNGNADQLARLKSLKEKVDLKYRNIESRVDSIPSGVSTRLETQDLALQQGLMEQIRNETYLMQRLEKGLLVERNNALRETSVAVTVIIIASIIIAFFLVGFAFSAHVKETRRRVQAQQKVASYQDELNDRIRELAQANTRLVEMKGQEKFAAAGRIALMVAHEIRNPLTNIDLANEQLAAEFTDEENTRFLSKVIERNSQRINHLVTELLNSTKFTDLHVEKVSLNSIIEEALLEARENLPWHDVTLTKKYGADSCNVMVDRSKMKVALVNILSNALEARLDDRPTQFVIETKKHKDGTCMIKITDDGRRMEDEEFSTLFEPYFTHKPNANGLALINSQNIILNHKGNIAVKTKKEVGTSFTITLHSEA